MPASALWRQNSRIESPRSSLATQQGQPGLHKTVSKRRVWILKFISGIKEKIFADKGPSFKIYEEAL